MYNKAVIMGRICNDLELKTTPSGVSVLTFSVAVERRYQNDKENKQTDFFNCVAWRNEAEFISRFWSKGRMILVEGELQNRKYTDKTGTERQITELIVERACFTGEKTERDVPPPPEEPPQYKKQEKSAEQKPAETPTAADIQNAGDDWPF